MGTHNGDYVAAIGWVYVCVNVCVYIYGICIYVYVCVYIFGDVACAHQLHHWWRTGCVYICVYVCMCTVYICGIYVCVFNVGGVAVGTPGVIDGVMIESASRVIVGIVACLSVCGVKF